MPDINQILVKYGLPLVFGAVLVEQIGVPLPAIPWLLAIGALTAEGTNRVNRSGLSHCG
jgi:hypothetical protein